MTLRVTFLDPYYLLGLKGRVADLGDRTLSAQEGGAGSL